MHLIPDGSNENDYVVERPLDHRQPTGNLDGNLKFKVKWFGHEVMTWESIAYLNRSQIVCYWKWKDMPLPAQISSRRTG